MTATRRLIGAVLLTMVWAGVVSAEATDKESPPAGKRGDRKEAVDAPQWRQLDLTAEQKEGLKALRERHQEALQDAQACWKSAQEGLQIQVQAVEFNEQAVRQASRKAAEAAEELAVLRARHASEVRALLTPEQRAKWDALRADAQARRRERMADRRERAGQRRERRRLGDERPIRESAP